MNDKYFIVNHLVTYINTLIFYLYFVFNFSQKIICYI